MNPEFTQDEIVYQQYGIDLVGLIRYLIEKVLGMDFGNVMGVLQTIWDVYAIIALLLSLVFFIGFVYAKSRFDALCAEEQGRLRAQEARWAELYGGGGSTHGRWAEIQAHLHEDNPNSWKIAIIEADIFLESVLTDHGYVGATMGEKLKSANSSSFTTIQDAWEAHKVRNEIAHAGQNDFILTRRVAQETLMRYERVLNEFGALTVKVPEAPSGGHGH